MRISFPSSQRRPLPSGFRTRPVLLLVLGALLAAGWGARADDDVDAYTEGTNQAELHVRVNGQNIASGFTPGLHTWYHVAVTWSTDQLLIYVNGQLTVGGISHPVITPPPLMRQLLGDSLFPRLPFSGALDEVSVYARVLTAQEISALDAAGAGGKCRW